MEQEWSSPYTDLFQLAMEGAFYLIAFCCALRGEEVPLVDLYGVKTHWEEGETHPTKHVVIALLGRFKGETGENYHLMCIVDKTNHGLEPRRWIGRLLNLYDSMGIQNGPYFRDNKGQHLRARDFEPKFHERLDFVKAIKPHLMTSVEDVMEEYGIYRSFRRVETSEAVNQGVPPEVIDANN